MRDQQCGAMLTNFLMDCREALVTLWCSLNTSIQNNTTFYFSFGKNCQQILIIT